MTYRITDRPDPRRRTAPLRQVVVVRYAATEGGMVQELDCGHVNIKPRRSHNFTVKRARCLTCAMEEGR